MALGKIIPLDPPYAYGNPSFTLDNRVKYVDEFAQRAADMAAFGATEAQIADRLGVTVHTLRRWYNTYPAFNEAMRLNMEAADERVKRALYQRAVGYEYVSEEIKTVSIGDGISQIERVPTVVHVPADAKAAMGWLAKRCKAEWGDAPLISVNNYEKMSDEQLRTAFAAAVSELAALGIDVAAWASESDGQTIEGEPARELPAVPETT